ncbi:MAG: DUF4396 domain-containing protein [Simkaniaceae bacterium]
MLQGILLLWSVLVLLSFVFIVYDLIKVTPEHWVMKLGWALVVLYTGPLGLFFYFLSCREPLPGTHEKFIAARWKQALGSEIHCLAGDATGIILAAVILHFYELPSWFEIILEYISAFIIGLFVFQALFMKKMHGGTYIKAVKNTIYSETVSMNMIMTGMIPVMIVWGYLQPSARNPMTLNFWGMMSLATIVGGIFAYPMNYWLVKKGLKHGMMTVRRSKERAHAHAEEGHMGEEHMQPQIEVSVKEKRRMLYFSAGSLALGVIAAVVIVFIFKG